MLEMCAAGDVVYVLQYYDKFRYYDGNVEQLLM